MLKHKDLQSIGKVIGIHKLGVSRADAIQTDRLNTWLGNGFHGQMGYMERNLDKRLDPGELLPGAQSIISIFVNYHQEESFPAIDGVISKYARSRDYHVILKDLLHDLAGQLFSDEISVLSRKERAKVYRVFVDSAPVMEKHWAVQSGIGWQGKHSNIITKELGSWGFLGEIITTEVFDTYDVPIPDYCGTCTSCIDACPTNAIVEPYQVDGSKCISYATIELDSEEAIPAQIRDNMGEWVFGCDICQDVCPWNSHAKPTENKDFLPVEGFARDEAPAFHQMDDSEFDQLFGTTPLERPGLKGMRRNQQKTL